MIGPVREIRELRALLGRHGLKLPDIGWKLTALSLYVGASQGDLERRARVVCGLRLTRAESVFFRRCCQRLLALHLLLAHDDDLDGAHVQVDEYGERLAECLVLMWRGLYAGESVDRDERIVRRADQLSRRSEVARGGFAAMVSRIAARPGPGDEWRARNIQEAAAFELGRGLAQLRAGLARVVSQDTIAAHDEFLDARLALAAFAQMQSWRQKDITNIRWRDYIAIAIGKSTTYLDIGASIRSYLTPVLFADWRLSAGPFCEQIYLDDLLDFDLDSADGIFAAPHIFLSEQGRIGDMLCARGARDIAGAAAAVADAGLLMTSFEGVLIAPRQPAQDDRDGDSVLRAALCNVPGERTLPIADLAARRMREARALRAAVGGRDAKRASAILLTSGVLARFSRGLGHIVARRWRTWFLISPVYCMSTIGCWVGLSAWCAARRMALGFAGHHG